MYMIESTCGDYPTVVFSTIPVEINCDLKCQVKRPLYIK